MAYGKATKGDIMAQYTETTNAFIDSLLEQGFDEDRPIYHVRHRGKQVVYR